MLSSWSCGPPVERTVSSAHPDAEEKNGFRWGTLEGATQKDSVLMVHRQNDAQKTNIDRRQIKVDKKSYIIKNVYLFIKCY